MTNLDSAFERLGEPTPNQIAERAAAIRKTWPLTEFHKRLCTITRFESDSHQEKFTLEVECRNSDLEDK